MAFEVSRSFNTLILVKLKFLLDAVSSNNFPYSSLPTAPTKPTSFVYKEALQATLNGAPPGRAVLLLPSSKMSTNISPIQISIVFPLCKKPGMKPGLFS